jgi:hypothetical protein
MLNSLLPKCSLQTVSIFLISVLALAGCATQPREVVYTATDLGLETFFSDATARFRIKSRDLVEAELILGQLNDGKRSGQDAFYWAPALWILSGCSAKRLGEQLGHKTVTVLITELGKVDPNAPSEGERAIFQFVDSTYAQMANSESNPKLWLFRFDGPDYDRIKRDLCEKGMK